MEMYEPAAAGLLGPLTVPSTAFTTAACLHFPPASVQLTSPPAEMAGETEFMATSPSVRIWPVDWRTTGTSAVPLVGALMGIMKLICPGETRSSGAGWPLKSTCVSARRVGNGTGLGCWLALAVSVPNATPSG